MDTTETANENEDDHLSMIKEVGATFTSTFVNVINCIIGAGILSIPATVHNTGLFGAFSSFWHLWLYHYLVRFT